MLKLMIFSLLSLLLYADGPVVKSGQTTIYISGDDGAYRAGVQRSYSRDNAVGVVTDHSTKLQWQDDATHRFMAWSAAQTYCAQLNIDGMGWRLPTKRELETLVDYSRSDRAIDPAFFNIGASTYKEYYWSSTAYIRDNTQVAVVTFHDGYSQGRRSKTDSLYVRCVRANNQ